jgi:hypothetical protein
MMEHVKMNSTSMPVIVWMDLQALSVRQISMSVPQTHVRMQGCVQMEPTSISVIVLMDLQAVTVRPILMNVHQPLANMMGHVKI